MTRGAEMVEFAFVVVLLIALLYGIISYGMILSAQSTVTQAAADGARAGIVAASTTLGPQGTAEGQAANDLSWMDKGQCYQPHAPALADRNSGRNPELCRHRKRLARRTPATNA